MPLSNIGARNTYKAGKVTLKQIAPAVETAGANRHGADRQCRETGAVRLSRAVEAQREARIYAEAALDAEQKKYAVGKSTTFTVLQLQNTLTTDRAAEIRALANYNEDLANLPPRKAARSNAMASESG